MAKSFTRKKRPKGVSKKEWDKSRKSEGRDPFASFFSDPEPARRERVRLSAQKKKEADEFIRTLPQPQSIRKPQLGVFGQQPNPFQAPQSQQFVDQLGQGVSARPQELKPEEKAEADNFLERFRKSAGPKIESYFNRLEEGTPQEKLSQLGQTYKTTTGKIGEFLGATTEDARIATEQSVEKNKEISNLFKEGKITEQELGERFKKEVLPNLFRQSAEQQIGLAEIGGIKAVGNKVLAKSKSLSFIKSALKGKFTDDEIKLLAPKIKETTSVKTVQKFFDEVADKKVINEIQAGVDAEKAAKAETKAKAGVQDLMEQEKQLTATDSRIHKGTVDSTDLFEKKGKTDKFLKPETVDEFIGGKPKVEPIAKTPEVKPKERGFISTVKESPQTAPEVKKGVSGTFESITNKETLASAKASIAPDFEGAVSRVKNETQLTTKVQAESLEIIEQLQAKGRYDDAIQVVDKMAERATEGGQATQILAAYNRLTPRGIVKFAEDTIRKAKVASPKRYGNLKLSGDDASRIRKMAEGIEGLTGQDKIDATKKMLDEIARLVPTPTARKLTTLWKAGLLTGIKGAVGGNTIGNTSMAIMKKLSDIPASGIDQAISTITGTRSKAFSLKGIVRGFGEGLKVGFTNLRKGVGADEVATKLDYKKAFFSKSILGRAAQKYTDSVFNFYSASDRPFYHSALKNSLYDLAEVEAKNKKLSGKAYTEFVEKLVKSPTDDILTKAHDEATELVFQNKNVIGGGLSGAKTKAKEVAGEISPLAESATEVVAEGVLPFTGVPSSIATAVHNYSPTGAVSGAYQAIVSASKGNFDQAAQRALSEALGKGVTGTAVLWLGAKLVEDNLMTLGYPTDAGERSLWEKEGKQPYSILLGGKWRSLNYTGPIMSLLATGGAVSEKGLTEGVLEGAGAVVGSSPLQGVQGALDAVTDPDRYGKSYVKNVSSSIIPTLVKDIAVSLDTEQREKNTIKEALQAKIPFLRENLLPKRDITGDILERRTTAAGALFDPFKSSEAKSDTLTTELRRLQDAGFGPTMSKLNKSQTINGEKIELSPEELNDFEIFTGRLVKTLLPELMNQDYYKNMSDEEKKKEVNDIIDSIRATAKNELLGNEAKPTIGAEEDINARKNYEEVQSLIKAGKLDEARDAYPKTANDVKAYKRVETNLKSANTRKVKVRLKGKIDEIADFYKQGNNAEGLKILNSLPEEDQSAVVSAVKKKLNL